MDLERVGGCFPGATVTEATGESFAGTVKVKLGPIALQYAGTGAFVERDDAAHRAVIEAKGKDKRGNGTAGATVTMQLAPAEGGAHTRVDVATELAITGKPAQFGRGVMQDVSDKLLPPSPEQPRQLGTTPQRERGARTGSRWRNFARRSLTTRAWPCHRPRSPRVWGRVSRSPPHLWRRPRPRGIPLGRRRPDRPPRGRQATTRSTWGRRCCRCSSRAMPRMRSGPCWRSPWVISSGGAGADARRGRRGPTVRSSPPTGMVANSSSSTAPCRSRAPTVPARSCPTCSSGSRSHTRSATWPDVPRCHHAPSPGASSPRRARHRTSGSPSNV